MPARNVVKSCSRPVHTRSCLSCSGSSSSTFVTLYRPFTLGVLSFGWQPSESHRAPTTHDNSFGKHSMQMFKWLSHSAFLLVQTTHADYIKRRRPGHAESRTGHGRGRHCYCYAAGTDACDASGG